MTPLENLYIARLTVKSYHIDEGNAEMGKHSIHITATIEKETEFFGCDVERLINE